MSTEMIIKMKTTFKMYQITQSCGSVRACLCWGEGCSWNNTPWKDKDLQHDGPDGSVWHSRDSEMDMFQWNKRKSSVYCRNEPLLSLAIYRQVIQSHKSLTSHSCYYWSSHIDLHPLPPYLDPHKLSVLLLLFYTDFALIYIFSDRRHFQNRRCSCWGAAVIVWS